MTSPIVPLNVLIGCESSGKVREAFRARGHNAYSCDLSPADDGSPYHLQCNLLYVLHPTSDNTYYRGKPWDLLIAHPPCTYLSSSGLHWNVRREGRKYKIEPEERAARTEAAIEFVRTIMAADIEKIAIENPIGRIGTAIRPADQIIQPYEFGEDASKQTCLWLKGLRTLAKDPAQRVAGRMVEWPKGSGRMVERWSNQTDSGQNVLTPSEDRWKLRSETYQGIADAMATQWGEATFQPVGSLF